MNPRQTLWEASDLLRDAERTVGPRRQELMLAAFTLRQSILGGDPEVRKAMDDFDRKWIAVYAGKELQT